MDLEDWPELPPPRSGVDLLSLDYFDPASNRTTQAPQAHHQTTYRGTSQQLARVDRTGLQSPFRTYRTPPTPQPACGIDGWSSYREETPLSPRHLLETRLGQLEQQMNAVRQRLGQQEREINASKLRLGQQEQQEINALKQEINALKQDNIVLES